MGFFEWFGFIAIGFSFVCIILEFIQDCKEKKRTIKDIILLPIKTAIGGIKVLWFAITNLKLYNRWVKIQYIRDKKLKIEQEKKQEELMQNAIKQNSIKNFLLRRKPNLLKFCKLKKEFFKLILAVIAFLFKAIGMLILIALAWWFLSFIFSNPLYIIIFLLILILIKR